VIGATLFLMADGGDCPRCDGALVVTLDALHRPRTRCVRCQGVAPYRLTQPELEARLAATPLRERVVRIDVRSFAPELCENPAVPVPEPIVHIVAASPLPPIKGTRHCGDGCGRFVDWTGTGMQPKRCDVCDPLAAATRARQRRQLAERRAARDAANEAARVVRRGKGGPRRRLARMELTEAEGRVA
jgi:hypothetical protein